MISLPYVLGGTLLDNKVSHILLKKHEEYQELFNNNEDFNLISIYDLDKIVFLSLNNLIKHDFCDTLNVSNSFSKNDITNIEYDDITFTKKENNNESLKNYLPIYSLNEMLYLEQQLLNTTNDSDK